MGNCCGAPQSKGARYADDGSGEASAPRTTHRVPELTGTAFSVSRSLTQPQQVYVGYEEGLLLCLDTAAGNIVRRYTGHTDDVLRCFPCGSQHLVSSSRDTTVRLWSDSDGTLVSTLNAHESAVSGLAVVSPGLVCSGARDAFVAFWDLSTSQCLSKEFIGQNTVTSMCMLPSSSPLVVQGAEDLCFRLWDPRDFRVSKVIGKGILQYFPTCVAASRDGNRIAIGTNGFDGSGCLVMTFDVRNSSQPLKIFSGHQHKLTSVQFAPTDLEEFVVSSSKDHTLRIWDTLTGKESFSTSFNDDSATDLSVSRMAATDLPSVCASFFGGGVWDMRWQSKHEEPQLQCTSECLGPSHLSPFSSPVHIS